MSKIIEIVKIQNCDTLRIFKRERSKYWYCRFYIGRKNKSDDGMFQCSLKTINQKDSIIQKTMETWDYIRHKHCTSHIWRTTFSVVI